jgi:hypothetical protein
MVRCAGMFHVLQRRFAWPLLIGLSLMFFQQITGQPSVLYYATRMFQKAGLSMGQQSTGIAGVLGAFKLIMTCALPFPLRGFSCLFPRVEQNKGRRAAAMSFACTGLESGT